MLSRQEVHGVLSVIEHPVRRMALTTIYALGLRLGEGLRLEVGDVQSTRQVVMIRDGKGGKDRAVPLPNPLLVRLRKYWKQDRPASQEKLLFVGAEGTSIHESTLQKTFTAACADAKLSRHATSRRSLDARPLGGVAMPTLADVIRQHGPGYEARFGANLLPSHARALRDIVRCRSPTLGGHLMQCADCGYRHLVYHSCRNRACATCGAERAAAWCERQRALLLPVSYFHVVFTVPAELRDLVRAHQKALIAVLFKAAFEALAALCADPRHLGGTIGALAVLHTWTRTLQWHPHVHLLVPGGALSSSGRWIRAKRRRRRRRSKPNKPYLVPARALSVKFWGRFLRLARKALPAATFPDMPSKQHWVVNIKPVLQKPERVIDYLGRYIQRTAISDRAIVDCDERQVTFRYRDSRDGRGKLMSLPGQQFVRRFLQHVLPRGVHRVRAFGLLHPSKRTTLQRLQLLLTKRTALPEPVAQTRAEASPCRQCGAVSWKRGPRLSPQQCDQALAELELTAHAVSARGPPVAMTERD